MDRLVIVKIGGNIVDDEDALQAFLQAFAGIEGAKLLIHGGGKLATRMGEQLGLPQTMVEGRRITDAETLRIVTMVYAGLINKNIVARLQAWQCNAFGLTGADGNAVQAHKRKKGDIDYGFAGDVDEVNGNLLHQLIRQGLTPVIAPVTHDGNGQLLNTNADTIAQETATAMSGYFNVELVYSFEKSGVLLDVNDEGSVIPSLQPAYYRELRDRGAIFAGMIPKLDNAFTALDKGVKKVIIGNAMEMLPLLNGEKGTAITNG